MASSVAQYPFLSSSIKSSIEVVHPTTPRRKVSLIKALKDSSSSSSESQQPDPVKLALARAKAYKKSIQSNPAPKIAQNQAPGSEISEFGGNKDESLSRVAMEGAREYSEKNRAVEERIDKKEESRISAIDFVGLGFADKKEGRGLPAGLIPISDPFPAGDLPDVEIIVGDTSRFGNGETSESDTTVEEDSELYKPKVSTWGVFPRPNNISKTFGGGKTIRPGDVLETAESKAAKEARTRQMIAAYKQKIGLNIDPKLKFECEKDLKDGDSLMEIGKLKDAIPFYERVMDKLVYQSELHGLAALQWSICKDSLNRFRFASLIQFCTSNISSFRKSVLLLLVNLEKVEKRVEGSDEARVMYEKLQSHPNVRVSKKARQFVFSFQAMEMMKVTSSSNSQFKTGYQNFFDAFIENKNNPSSNETETEEDASLQALPYVIFLVSPILMVLVIAVQKRLV
ncbi:hypothetical protein Ccrd_000535 [Cynara cardunculus var. scolymus]|uniref:Uncharacterized protein n=1 Tax=Cynara cardunculus var. scolymus TaxID=59895 RepID=A0A118JY87_CYNCS|nr:hypothetical protein Ccrd_000535 [Cynara cardunculus var. scolymus]